MNVWRRLALPSVILAAFAFAVWLSPISPLSFHPYNTQAQVVCPALPYTFTNGTIADANQVNSDFTSMQNCIQSVPFIASPPLNLYVSTVGNDSGQCTLAAPCLTPQRAVNLCYSKDVNTGDCVITINAGTYSSPNIILLQGPLRGGGTTSLVGRQVVAGGSSAAVVFLGVGNPILTHTGAGCGTIYVSSGAYISLAGTLTLQSASSCSTGGELAVQYGGFVSIVSNNVTFGPMTEVNGSQINIQLGGGVEVGSAGYKIAAPASSTTAQNHVFVSEGGMYTVDGSAAITCVSNGGNAVNYSGAFIAEQLGGFGNVGVGTTFTSCGTSGLQVSVTGGSIVQNFASATNAIPGTGSACQGGGEYIDAANHSICANGVSGSNAFSNPSGTTSASGVMMGLGTGFTFAPATTGRIFVDFSGNAVNSAGGGGGSVTLYYGTGTAPTNGAAIPGGATVCGATQTISSSAFTANTSVGFSLPCFVKLTAGTTYWLDLAVSSVSGLNTESLNNVARQIFEVN